MLPRGCMPLILLVLALFVAAPLDAQEWLLSGARWLWLEPLGRYVVGGFVAGLFGVMLGYNAIWNAASYNVYLEDLRKAEEAYRRRKR